MVKNAYKLTGNHAVKNPYVRCAQPDGSQAHLQKVAKVYPAIVFEYTNVYGGLKTTIDNLKYRRFLT